jgi:hypothetical protein
LFKRIFQVVVVFVFATALIKPLPTAADNIATDFEVGFTAGTPNGQFGWMSLGSAGNGCAAYDHQIIDVTTMAPPVSGFGNRALRISNAVTSGCFNDQTFSAPTVNAVGESNAVNNGQDSKGTLQKRFEGSFTFMPINGDQTGLSVVVSPDMRGVGNRMSWVQLLWTSSGVQVNFSDYIDAFPFGTNDNPEAGRGPEDDFKLSTIVSGLSLTQPHTIKITLDAIDGPRNDVVQVFVDGMLKKVGTSWEDYYRWAQGPGDPEQSANVRESRTVNSLLFRTGGAAVPGLSGKGYLFDNVQVASMTPLGFRVEPWIYPTNATNAKSEWLQLNVLNSDACKNGGHKSPGFGDGHPSSFPNKGQCLSYANNWNHNANWVLNLEKNTSTSNNVAAGATIEFGGNITLTEFGFDYNGYCGAGAPRFNVYTTDGTYYFFGCSYGVRTSLGNGWTRVLFSNADAVPASATAFPGFGNAVVTRIEIVMDEQGQTTLDNIDVNGVLVGKP